jgi:hypothetical protein
MPVTVTVDKQKYAELEATLAGVKDGAVRAATAAVNRTAQTGRTIIVRRLVKELNLKSRQVRDTITIRKASFEKPEAVIRISKKPIPLIEFPGTRQAPAGVSVQVRKGKREVLSGTFIATMKSGHRGVFERRRLAGAKRAGRLPIKERMGPTPMETFNRAPGVAQEVLAELGPTLEKNLASQVDRLLQRRKAAE